MIESNAGKVKHIVLIHGLFLNWECWNPWVERYTAAGYTVHAIGWPGMEGTVAEIRANPEPLKHLSIGKVADFYESYVRGLDSPPIIIGHSFGGLMAQLLAYRGLGAASVGLDPTAPAGLYLLPFSSLKSSLPVLGNPLSVGEATPLTLEQFQYGFTNTLTVEETKPIYDRYAVPCVNRVFFEGVAENFLPNSAGHIDVEADRRPVLLIAGGADHIVTPEYTRAHFHLIDKSPAAITGFVEFANRPHFSGGVPGWEEIADYALQWALQPIEQRP